MLPLTNRLILVSGNQSGDLDSIVSSYVKADLLRRENKNSAKVVCLFNFAKIEWRLRPEAAYLFEQQNIESNNIIFQDEIDSLDLNVFAENKSLQIVLIDHNSPEKTLQDYSEYISEIIDHHKDLSPENPHINKTIFPSGSCATLIWEQFSKDLHNQPGLFDKAHIIKMANMLYSTIRMDTDHLKDNPEYELHRDEKAMGELFKYIDVDDAFISNLKKIKYDMNSFSILDHLLKDHKFWNCQNIPYGMSTLYIDIIHLISSEENYKQVIRDFLKKENLDILFLMHLTKKPILKRELTVTFSDSFHFKNEVLKDISDSEIFKEITPDDNGGSLFTFFSQLKPEYSRKKIQPFIENLLIRLKD